MRRFVIERDISGIGKKTPSEYEGAARTSNGALRELGPKIQWVHSYVVENKTFCIYLATDEDLIRKHAALSGFPANKITEVVRMIDPTTELGCG